MLKRLFASLVTILSVQLHAQTADSISALLTALKGNDASVDFKIEATVSAPLVYDHDVAAIPLTDKTGSWVLRGVQSTAGAKPALGDKILICGMSQKRGKRDPVSEFSITILGSEATRPRPTPVSVPQLKGGAFDWRYIRLNGIVRDVLPSDTNANWIFLVLCADGDTTPVAVPLNGTPVSDFTALLRTPVVIDCFCCPRDGSLRLYQGRICQASGIGAITRQSNGQDDPFAVTEVSELCFRHPAEIAVSGLARAKGLVISRWGSHDALLQTDDGDRLHIVCSDCAPPEYNASIEVSGFPSSDLFHITLVHAIWRPIAPLAIKVDAPQTFSSDRLQADVRTKPSTLAFLHGKRIRFTACVRMLPDPTVRKDILLVENGPYIIPVDVSSAPQAVKDVLPGSTVEITATCVLNTDLWSPSMSYPQIHGFTAVLNESDGLRVITRPPWWTAGRILSACGVVFLFLVGIIVYVQVTRSQAVLKTAERTRLAVELHDTLAQSLTGVSLELEAARNAIDDGNPTMTGHLSTAAHVLSSCRQELKNCLWDLRNKALDEDNFENAVRMTLRPLVDEERLSIRFVLPRRHLSDSGAHALLRIIRELVINAIRHGKATRIRIAGCTDRNSILCSVTDNGIGFVPENAPGVRQGHFGLQGLRERISELHGSVEIRSAPGRGTQARISIPMGT